MPARYGTWPSPITSDIVASGGIRLGSIALDADDIYWIEGRPEEGGRSVIVRRRANGEIADATPTGTNVRTRVHEYGGAAYVVWRGTIYYAEFTDQRLYELRPGRLPQPLTPAGQWFYADACVHPSGEYLVCVREDHTDASREAITTLVRIPLHLEGLPPHMEGTTPPSRPSGRFGETRRSLGGGGLVVPEILVSGHDFYSTPRFSPDGSRLSWLAWNHPNMPWDGTELWVANINDDGTLDEPRLITGDSASADSGDAIFQPGWSPDGTLYFVSDRTGWWNLYRVRNDVIEPVWTMAADAGRPMWQLGMSTWAFAGPSRIIVNYQERGPWRMASVDPDTGRSMPFAVGLEPGENIAATPTHAVFAGGSTAAPDAIVRVEIRSGIVETLRAASRIAIDPAYLSPPEAIEFPTDAGLTAHGFLYRPRNRDVTAPAGERPPLIVISHGGPTASTSARLNLEIQFWTSRGFAVVDVNYRGSSGYGRAYRRGLTGWWGIVDVADCVNAAAYLVAQDIADATRLIIRGRSAGGYTTLAALTFRPEVFKAGASYYGISDLESMARDTHKFESRYLDSLIGPYPACRDTYRARSPIHFIDRLACPIAFFQGLEDRVVPPDQSEVMAEAVRAKGLRAELLTFAGEQHGFRQRATIVRCLEAELAFYATVFGFDDLSPI